MLYCNMKARLEGLFQYHQKRLRLIAVPASIALSSIRLFAQTKHQSILTGFRAPAPPQR